MQEAADPLYAKFKQYDLNGKGYLAKYEVRQRMLGTAGISGSSHGHGRPSARERSSGHGALSDRDRARR